MRITKVQKEFVFDVKNAPTPQCHASTILKLQNGDLLCAWFGGTREGAADVRIWLARRHDGIWSAPVMVADDLDCAHWNPVLFETRDGVVRLYYKCSPEIRTWRTYTATSTDGGVTFSAPRELVAGDVGGRGPVKNKPLYLADGTLLAPASIETPECWYGMIDISTDDGESWNAVRIPMIRPQGEDPALKLIQPTLWEAPEGCVHALLRSNKGAAYRSDSADGGRTWCAAYPTDLPNNHSGLDLTRLKDGTLALVCNPVSGRARTPLTLSFSTDNGIGFRQVLTLEDAEGEYSYPAVVTDGEALYITYTYRRETVAFVKVGLAADRS